MDKRMNVFLICSFSAWFGYLTFAQEEGCPLHWLTLSYKSLNCLPVKENGSKCPTSYDCSAYESRDKQVCHAFGKTYNISSPIEDDGRAPCISNWKNTYNLLKCLSLYPEGVLARAPCLSNCSCDESENGMAFTNCTYTECPFQVHIGCNLIQRPGQCCSTYHCGKREYSNINCSFGGDIYDEGEHFAPSNRERTCKQCTCQAGFKGELEEPHCHYVDCQLQLYRGEDLNNGCIPVFLTPLYCCPIRMKCPAETDEVIESTSKDVSKSSASCRFGNLTVPFGDSLNVVNNIDCTCDLPPILTCVERGKLF